MKASEKRKKSKSAKKRRRTRAQAEQPRVVKPAALPWKPCEMCGNPHVGDSEESFASLAALDPEAAVFYDRDIVGVANVDGLCGPRFRKNSAGLYAHYGSPSGARYVVYEWKKTCWKLIIGGVDEH